jgi:hypothetical protein
LVPPQGAGVCTLRNESKEQIRDLRLLVKILPIDENIVDIALSSKFSDFEDGLQYYTAKEQNLFGIITRNLKYYKIKEIVIQTSKEFVQTNTKLFEEKNENKNG